jgi:uncharacterized Fe-S center protein
MDENSDDDIKFYILNHSMINTTYEGSHLQLYDSYVVLSHFKGHKMGGFEGALKQLSIGFSTQRGKSWIHSAVRELDWTKGFRDTPQEEFTKAMADSAFVIVDYFKSKG